MNNVLPKSIKCTPIFVKTPQEAEEEISRGRFYDGGYYHIDSNNLHKLLLEIKTFSRVELRIFCALCCTQYKDEFRFDWARRALGGRPYEPKIKEVFQRLSDSFFAAREEKILEEAAFYKPLPNHVLRSMALNGSRAEIIITLWGCAKAKRVNYYAFGLPVRFLSRKFGLSLPTVRRAIQGLQKRGLMLPTKAGKKRHGVPEKLYYWFCSNFRFRLQNYAGLKVVRPEDVEKFSVEKQPIEKRLSGDNVRVLYPMEEDRERMVN